MSFVLGVYCVKKFLNVLVLFFAVLMFSSGAFASSSKWVPKNDEYWIKINKEQTRLTLYKGNEEEKAWYVAVGKGKGENKTSRLDLITPTGTFTIYRVIQDATTLVYDPKWFGEEGEPQKGVYGSKLISFYNKWQIAIHGTNAPWSIGKRVTHGCIRMRNKEIEDLVTYIKPKTKLVIVERDANYKFHKETL